MAVNRFRCGWQRSSLRKSGWRGVLVSLSVEWFHELDQLCDLIFVQIKDLGEATVDLAVKIWSGDAAFGVQLDDLGLLPPLVGYEDVG